jgi:hypothetical protein
MNTISDSLIEKLEELYPKPKPEVVPVKEEPVVVNTWVPDYTIGKPWVPDYTITTGAITSGGNYANGSYAIQSTNSAITLGTTTQYLTYDENSLMINTAGNTYPLPVYVQKIVEDNKRITVLDQMMIRESSGYGSVSLKQHISDKIFDFEIRMKEYIRQEIDKLKCSPGTPT